MTVNVRVLGLPIILGIDSDDIPEGSHRLGSVPIEFENGAFTKIRVFGPAPSNPSVSFQRNFEREIRAVCEDVTVYGELYGTNFGALVAKRFNPALVQRKRGWAYH